MLIKLHIRYPSFSQFYNGLEVVCCIPGIALVANCNIRPFRQLQYVQCTYHGLTFVLLCVPVLFADNTRCWPMITWCGFPLVFVPYFRKWPGFISENFFLFVMVCNEQSIYSYKRSVMVASLSSVWLIIGGTLRLPLLFTLTFCGNWIHAEKFLLFL